MNLPIVEGPILPNMFGLVDTGSGSNLVNMDYHQSVVDHYPNLVMKLAYLNHKDNVEPFNISGVDRGK